MRTLRSILVIFCASVVTVHCQPKNERFFYFAYGSNLFGNRLRIQNPSAIFYSIAKLDGYRLDFNMFVNSWRGAVATIVEEPGSAVWGALWTIEKSQMANLDDQEGVHTDWYVPKYVKVTTIEGQDVIARTYQERINPNNVFEMTIDRLPSFTYMQVIILGAIEIGLPSEYIKFLQSFSTNDQIASQEMLDRLGPPFNFNSRSSTTSNY